MKDEKGGKIIIKFVAAASKSYSYCVLKDYHEIEDLGFKIEKGVKTKVRNELRVSDYGHCVHNTANTPIAKEQVSFRSIIHNLHYNK